MSLELKDISRIEFAYRDQHLMMVLPWRPELSHAPPDLDYLQRSVAGGDRLNIPVTHEFSTTFRERSRIHH